MLKHIFLLLSIFCLSVCSYAIKPQTYEFAVVDGDTLRMDVYAPEGADSGRPAVLFAFGGAFKGGTRNDAQYVPFMEFLAANGIVAISTDYRTTLAKNPALLRSAEGIALAFVTAVSDAVSDFHLATRYIIRNAEKLGVDSGKIIASGSSAGAITALQAEYSLCNGAATVLPKGFGYAGVISFAGAVLSDGPLAWQRKPCPIQLYHGDADHNVPFATLNAGAVSLCGSATIAKSLADNAVPCEFFTFPGADHRICTAPMTDNLYDILGFIKRIDAGKETLSVTATVSLPGSTHSPAREITMEDLIKANL